MSNGQNQHHVPAEDVAQEDTVLITVADAEIEDVRVVLHRMFLFLFLTSIVVETVHEETEAHEDVMEVVAMIDVVALAVLVVHVVMTEGIVEKAEMVVINVVMNAVMNVDVIDVVAVARAVQ
jgi:hypothetical protein